MILRTDAELLLSGAGGATVDRLVPRVCVRGQPVERRTVQAFLTESALQRLSARDCRFCPDPACNVVYFDDEEIARRRGSTATAVDMLFFHAKEKIRRTVGVQHSEPKLTDRQPNLGFRLPGHNHLHP